MKEKIYYYYYFIYLLLLLLFFFLKTNTSISRIRHLANLANFKNLLIYLFNSVSQFQCRNLIELEKRTSITISHGFHKKLYSSLSRIRMPIQ